MARFSIESALSSGLKLVRREPKAVAVWGFANLGIMLLTQALMIGPALPALFRAFEKDPELADAELQAAMAASSYGVMGLVWLLAFAAMAVLYGAIYRALLHPEDRRFFYLRLSRRELWLAVTWLVLTAVIAIGLAAAVLAVILAAMLLSHLSGSSPWLWAFLLGAPFSVAGLYLMMRLSMAPIQAFDEQRFVLPESWAMTRGHGWRLVLMAAGLILLAIVLMLAFALVMAVAAMLGGLIAGALGDAGVLLMIVGGLALLVLYVVWIAAFHAVVISPYVEVYRALRGEPAPAT